MDQHRTPNDENIVHYESRGDDPSFIIETYQDVEILEEYDDRESGITKSLELLQAEEEDRKKLLEEKREQELLEEKKKRERKRGEVLNEILRTEKSYVESLEVLEKVLFFEHTEMKHLIIFCRNL